MACKRKSTAIDNLVELAPLDILEAAVKKKRKLMGIGAPAPVKQMRIPVQTHGYWDIKRIEIGLTDRQTLKSAKFDRLLYGHKNVQSGLAKHLVKHKKKYKQFSSIQDLEFEKNVKMASGETKTIMIRVPTFIVHDPVGFIDAICENRGYTSEDKVVKKVRCAPDIFLILYMPLIEQLYRIRQHFVTVQKHQAIWEELSDIWGSDLRLYCNWFALDFSLLSDSI